jgi:hypothetical protein
VSAIKTPVRNSFCSLSGGFGDGAWKLGMGMTSHLSRRLGPAWLQVRIFGVWLCPGSASQRCASPGLSSAIGICWGLRLQKIYTVCCPLPPPASASALFCSHPSSASPHSVAGLVHLPFLLGVLSKSRRVGVVTVLLARRALYLCTPTPRIIPLIALAPASPAKAIATALELRRRPALAIPSNPFGRRC